MKWIAMFFLLVFAGAASAQSIEDKLAEIEANMKKMVEAEKVAPPRFLSYSAGMRESISTGLPLVTFIGYEPTPIKGAIVCQAERLPGYEDKSIVVSKPEGGSLYWIATVRGLTREPTVAEIEKEVHRPLAAPFAQSEPLQLPARQTADDSPWLSSSETNKIKAIWPEKLQFPAGLKFYSLAPRYQNLYTMNNGSFKGRNIDPLHDEHHPFLVSGGMADLTGWGSMKGLDIPYGKRIKVWEENTDVRAFSLVPRWRWRFPTGTVAYDVLYTKAGIFEIRTQERTDDGWATKVLHRDKEAVPSGYTGLQQSCASCHTQTASVVDVPGRIYRRVRWGDDGRFSWRPFDDSGRLDNRWPIER